MIRNVTDGSFEEGKWVPTHITFYESPVVVDKEQSADGKRFVWFGGFDDKDPFFNQPIWQELELRNERIPTETTHLSLFIESSYRFDTTQKVFITIDSTVVLFFDKTVCGKIPTYQNVDIDVRRFADNDNHTIVLSYFADAPNDGSSFRIDYLRWIQDKTLQGNSHTFRWPQYKFCGGGCQTDLLGDKLCHENCNILPCNYDNGFCKKSTHEPDRCYNGFFPSYEPEQTICREYYKTSCCTNRYDRAFIEERISYFKNSSCPIDSDCVDKIEKAICAYCSPDSNKFIINGSIQFSQSFQDGLYSSCKSSYYRSDGSCMKIEKLFPDASAFLALFGTVTNDEEHCFDDLAHTSAELSDGVIAVICIVSVAVVVIPLVAIIIAVIYWKSQKKNNKESVVGTGDGGSNRTNEKKASGMKINVNGVCQNLSLVKPIGKGSFGTVWLAQAGKIMLAAKEIPRKKEATDYQKEMGIMLQLNSPYVVRMYGSVINNKSIFLLMEYAPLGSLSSALEKYSFSPYMRCRFMYEVSCGMEYLHSQGIIHRDLKPGNVLLSSFDLRSKAVCKISDFGESREGANDTQTAVMTRGVGTPYYMAPEMIRGDEKYTRAVDIYSFGIMCAELWNEQLPYNEVNFDTVLAFAMYVTEGNRPKVREDCPGPLLGLIRQCWAPDRQERPSFATIVPQLLAVMNNMASLTPANTQHVKVREGKEKEISMNVTQSVEMNNGKPPKSENGSNLDSLYFDEIPLDDITV